MLKFVCYMLFFQLITTAISLNLFPIGTLLQGIDDYTLTQINQSHLLIVGGFNYTSSKSSDVVSILNVETANETHLPQLLTARWGHSTAYDGLNKRIYVCGGNNDENG